MALPNTQRAVLEKLYTDPDLFQRFRDNPLETLAEFNISPGIARRWHRMFPTREKLADFLPDVSSLELSPPPLAADGGTSKGLSPEDIVKRIVNTGFVSDEQPEDDIDPSQTLLPNNLYHFWLDIKDKPSPKSIEKTPTALPKDLPADAELDVVMFEFPKEAKLLVGNIIGKLRLNGNFSEIVSPADVPGKIKSDIQSLGRLFFKIQTPSQPGEYHLRSNIYYKQTLLQSRLITLHVTESGQTQPEALISELDYALSHVFSPEQFKNMGENKLSLMINSDGDGTHGFKLYGTNEYVGNASLTEQAIAKLIETSRQELRRTAWGKTAPYTPENNYLYDGEPNLSRLKLDLIRLGLIGFEFYTALIHELSEGDRQKRNELKKVMREPGQVQIAAKQSLQLVLPAALIYDHPLDNGASFPNDYSVCPDFLQHLQDGTDLTTTACFQGNCPSYDSDTVVCPSGFWGYRHAIGLPVAIKNAPDAPTSIPASSKPELAVSVSTDPQFKQRPGHESNLQKLNIEWRYANTRDDSINMLKQTDAPIVYYYCHGGKTSRGPYIMVGPNDGPKLTPSNLLSRDVFFDNVRPLVFINGCHTTALTPEDGFDMVSAFIQTSHAAGVIGTEITIFESIATTFAESFFEQFVTHNQSIGEAVRLSRIKMLQKMNPLGLVYVPYAMPGLKLN